MYLFTLHETKERAMKMEGMQVLWDEWQTRYVVKLVDPSACLTNPIFSR